MIIMWPLLISSFVVSFSCTINQMFAVWFQVYQFYSEVCPTNTALRTRPERSGASDASLTHTLSSFLCSLEYILLFVLQLQRLVCAAFDVARISAKRSWHSQWPVILAFIIVLYTIGSMALPQNENGLWHYLDTILRTVERVMATNIGFNTSNELALVSRERSMKCVLCDLFYVSYSSE